MKNISKLIKNKHSETIEQGAVTSLMLYKENGNYVLKDVFSYNTAQMQAVSEMGCQMQ